MKTILVVDDEPKIVRTLKGYLEGASFRVITAADGQMALVTFRHEKPDLILLDLMLPGIDGLEVCQRIRREADVPIIMVTARAEEVDRLLGLEIGADDYIVKPFSPREVVARVRAVLRRAEGTIRASKVLRVGDIVLDIDEHQVSVAGRPVYVTPTEFNILAVLARTPGRAISRAQLMEQGQEVFSESMERTVDAHIRNLRAKLEPDPKNPRYLITVFGIGYKLQACDESDKP
ncbi:MAG: DNA-binding response regulator [Anaerolineae bacterium]|nr:DNA-binding response regulator [Anaerolineae bacterium]